MSIRGDLADTTFAEAVTAQAGCAMPGIWQISGTPERGLLWMSPDELLLLLPRAEAAEAALAGAGTDGLPQDVLMELFFNVQAAVGDLLPFTGLRDYEDMEGLSKVALAQYKNDQKFERQEREAAEAQEKAVAAAQAVEEARRREEEAKAKAAAEEAAREAAEKAALEHLHSIRDNLRELEAEDERLVRSAMRLEGFE